MVRRTGLELREEGGAEGGRREYVAQVPPEAEKLVTGDHSACMPQGKERRQEADTTEQ